MLAEFNQGLGVCGLTDRYLSGPGSNGAEADRRALPNLRVVRPEGMDGSKAFISLMLSVSAVRISDFATNRHESCGLTVVLVPEAERGVQRCYMSQQCHNCFDESRPGKVCIAMVALLRLCIMVQMLGVPSPHYSRLMVSGAVAAMLEKLAAPMPLSAVADGNGRALLSLL